MASRLSRADTIISNSDRSRTHRSAARCNSRWLLLRNRDQVTHDPLHILGTELVGRHDRSRREFLWIGKMPFQPFARPPPGDAVQRWAKLLARAVQLMAGAALIALVHHCAFNELLRSASPCLYAFVVSLGDEH